MSIPPRTQAVLLLTSRFSEAGDAAAEPLSPDEWGRFASWLNERSLAPERLLAGDLGRLLDAWSDETVALDRIKSLMGRGPALARAVEKWLRAGLWIMTRSDPDYPARLKKRLGKNSPAVLFGRGGRPLLGKGGLAVVGSRGASDADRDFSRGLGAKAAGGGRAVVSDCAGEIGEASLLGSLESGGTAVGVLAGGLLDKSSSGKYREHLSKGALALVSASRPDAEPDAESAARRDGYIHCLSDAAFVIRSSAEEGDVRRGAMEGMKEGWTPLWVRRADDGAGIEGEDGSRLPERIEDVDIDRLLAEALLRRAVGDPEAGFRDGQWEAIDALANHRRKLLVVQRTGWGKSSVYFISTRMLRNRGAGATVIVSPLLALMRNQIDAADRLGIRAETINSTNRNDWPKIKQSILGDRIDAVLVSPERLSNEAFVDEVLLPVADRIGLLVVDEAHCISDWGHDFRPDYRRLLGVLRQMPPNTPVLGTTATANNRVVRDVQAQLGDIEVLRGALVRDSLILQTLRLPGQASRLAWLAENIPGLPGTGIVYVLTVGDAERVARWLRRKGVDAQAYHGGVEHPDYENSGQYRQHLENRLLRSEIKALVATTALGMGYDKPDLGFVVHYQAPGSVVAYYQQVGRAGRAIETAYGILLSGKEDGDIHEYFRRSAFPDDEQVSRILDLLDKHDRMSAAELQERLNLRKAQIEKTLKLLSVEDPAPVIKDGGWWRRTAVEFRVDRERIERLTRQRETEWREIQDYIDHGGCLMSYLRNALDDSAADECGRCAVCMDEPAVGAEAVPSLKEDAIAFLKETTTPFAPKRWVPPNACPAYGLSGKLPIGLLASEGRILSHWDDGGWGGPVTSDRRSGGFRDELVDALAEMITRWRPDPSPQWVTCVPSLNHPTLVPDLAERLAAKLGLPFRKAIYKIKENMPQKTRQNSFHQCNNLDGAFEVKGELSAKPVLLVDDVIDSGWTVTVLAALLRQKGGGPVYPVALVSAGAGG